MPKDMSSVRYSRMLKVIALMKSKKKVTRAELEAAGKYPLPEPGQQNRMLQRDLQFMREELGAEIEYDYKDNVYVLKHEGSLLVNINASPSEIEALRAGLRIASHFLPHLADDADSLWEKLSGYIPRRLAEQGQALAESAVVAIPVARVNPEVFKLLVDAKNTRRTVRIRYVSPGKEGRTWTLSPYDFYFRGSAWYMISFNHKHKALSTHRMSRILRASFANDEYVPPEDGGFNEGYTASAWYVSPGTEKHKVVLRLEGSLGESALSVKWHPSQQTELQDDGSVLLTAEVPHLDEIARWVLAGAPNAKVIAPARLKYLVRDLAFSLIDEE